MAASDYVPISFKNRLHLAGRPQMGSRPSLRPIFRFAMTVCGTLPQLPLSKRLLHSESRRHHSFLNASAVLAQQASQSRRSRVVPRLTRRHASEKTVAARWLKR